MSPNRDIEISLCRLFEGCVCAADLLRGASANPVIVLNQVIAVHTDGSSILIPDYLYSQNA